MRSYYDVLGARVDDDAQAIKKAFRAAVKAHHPDLHPGDPDAVLRFRRIVRANTILRDEMQRAAYDQLLEVERQQIKLERRQTWLKLGATVAVAAVCALAGSYGLLTPMPTTAVVEIMKDKPPTAETAAFFETIINGDKAAVSTGASLTAARVSEAAASAVMDVMLTNVTPADREEGAPPTVQDGGRAMAHAGEPAIAGTAIADGVLKAGAAPSAADKDGKGGDAFALADHEPAVAQPNSANFYREMGTASYRVGDFPLAIVNLDEAIRLDPNDAKAYNVRGNAWDEIGVFDNALADYDAAIRIDPNNPVFFHDRAVMWHRRGNLDKALVDLDRAIRFTFSDPNIYCDRGLVWYEKGSHARAVADFDHAVKIDPDFAAAYISRGLILHRNSEFNVAFADLGRTIRVSPGVFDVAKRLASHP